MRTRASLRDGLTLALVSTVVILYISWVTLGQGKQSRVEARLPQILEQADHAGVPLPALMALCVAESHRDQVRSDETLAAALAASMRPLGGDLEAALRALYPDPIEHNLVLDLYRMNRDRWSRLASQIRNS